MTSLSTKRLFLRPPATKDAQWLADGLGDYAIAQNLLVPHPYNIEMATKWLSQDWASFSDANTRFIIELDKANIGGAGLSEQNGEAVLSYWLYEQYWGQRFATEAARAVVNWYFNVTRAERILSGTFHFNMASLAIQQKLGFVETGRSTKFCPARNEDVEHIDTELTRDAL